VIKFVSYLRQMGGFLRDLQLPVQSVPFTTKVVSLNPVNGEVYSLQLYVIKFVSDLRWVGGFLRVLRFPPPLKHHTPKPRFTLLKTLYLFTFLI
jgi:hypothetical protein